MTRETAIPAGRPMTDDAPGVKNRLAFLAARQRMLDGSAQRCPRCGRPDIKPKLHANALSRHADICVCDICGNQEAVLVSRGRRLPFREWAAARPDFHPEIRKGDTE